MTVSAVTAPIAGDRTAHSGSPVAVPAGASGASPSFAATLDSASRTGAASPGTVDADDNGRMVYQHSKSGELKPLQQFESFVLRSFIENMMPTEEASFFGTGSAGKIWKSMLAERMADEMSAAGGIGIADMLGKERGADASKASASDTPGI